MKLTRSWFVEKIDSMEGELSTVNERMSNTMTGVTEAIGLSLTIDGKVSKIEENVSQLALSQVKLGNQQDELKERQGQIDAKIDETKENVSNLELSHTELGNQHDELKERQRQMNAKIDETKENVSNLELSHTELGNQHDELKERQRQMNAKIDETKRVDGLINQSKDDSHPSKVRSKKRSKDRRAPRSDKNASSDESESMFDQPGAKRMRYSCADDVHNLKEQMAVMVQKNAELEMDWQRKFSQDEEIKRQLSELSNKTSHENSCIISTLQDLKSELTDLKQSSNTTTSRENWLMISKIDNLTDKVDHLEEYVEREIGNRNLKKDRCIGDREKKK
ncbi:interaptin-like isoform X2 [Dendronephthya gigantea]|uniref:interaptin-like isoform X2 n=1 Tax=Dendronephthya gigantea TaxID=151771 RepID=UPI00106C4082|nr:interaptin-like isoform X2 [Dendronephthya gigantea]